MPHRLWLLRRCSERHSHFGTQLTITNGSCRPISWSTEAAWISWHRVQMDVWRRRGGLRYEKKIQNRPIGICAWVQSHVAVDGIWRKERGGPELPVVQPGATRPIFFFFFFFVSIDFYPATATRTRARRGCLGLHRKESSEGSAFLSLRQYYSISI